MDARRSDNAEPALLEELLGYLNFSSGAEDPQFLRNLNEMYRRIEGDGRERHNSWRMLHEKLSARIQELAAGGAAFRDAEQARGVLGLVFEHLVPAYRQFHRDLLFHQSDAALWRPLLLGRVFEAVLHQGGPWDEHDRIVPAAIDQLGDYIGYRPVAVLHNTQRMEPYEHEWIRPIPLWIRDVGPAAGKFRQLIERALDILRATDPKLLRAAAFDPDLLDELALDPRAYDFDHPVNKRPNYHFGQWDPHHLDMQGRYRRFVVQQVTLDALLQRVENPGELAADQLLSEAAAVLAGTILMASGTSGSGPDAYDSTVTLATLLPRIAAYRDAFYKPLIERLPPPHRKRLEDESVSGRQPFAGARQHLNHELARRRAAQLEHVHLAVLFARLGYPEAALRQAHVVPVASARIVCEMQCRISTGHLAVEQGEVGRAAELLTEIEDFLRRGIECGALVDPWNVLGFQGQFSLFPSPENSVPDHRVDQFIELVSEVFSLYAHVWSEAAARNEPDLEKRLARRFEERAKWWDKFATTSVESVESFSGRDAFESARQVAEALRAWHQGGASVGDIGFWRKHVEEFNSPKAYALVVERLLEKRDVMAAMALLLQWLSQAETVPLRQGEFSFHRLTRRLFEDICQGEFTLRSADGARPVAIADRTSLVTRLLDHLEANADELWQVPRLELESSAPREVEEDEEQTDDDESNPYQAAYDEMVYKDSTNDGIEGEMLESGGPPATDYELEHESRRLKDRLALIGTAARLWKQAALVASPAGSLHSIPRETLSGWLQQAEKNATRLAELLTAVERRRIPAPTASRESLLEYDRRRNVKESLLETIIGTSLETAHGERFLRAALADESAAQEMPIDLAVWRAVLSGDAPRVRELWPELLVQIRTQPVLYVPLSKGGESARIVAARSVQQSIRDLLRWLPRLGLITETCQLIEAARVMEIEHPVGAGAVTEFDRLFEVGYKSLVEMLVNVSEEWSEPHGSRSELREDDELVECLEQLTESLLRQWLAHSRTLRLSVLEKIVDEKAWKAFVAFIEKYGHDLFTQRFLNLGNLRAILHQGIDIWLAQMQEDPDNEDELKLLGDLDTKLPRPEAVKQLGLVIEAVAENYTEYRDYNTTTTQSDRGEMLYTLLDFLRLRVHYDRVAWNLRPVILAHEILVRRSRDDAAELWRRAIMERTSEVADSLERRLAELRKQYAIRLPTVSDRLAERFVRPLAIDRVRALIAPAIEDVRAREGEAGREGEAPAEPREAGRLGAFELLEQEIEELTQQPTGAGLDVPSWLQALEEEVATAQRAASHGGSADDYELPLAQVPLTLDEIQREIAEWDKR